jgi:serine protease DegS
MTGNEIRRGALFLGGSVTGGLLLALLAVLLWPQLLNRDSVATQTPADAEPALALDAAAVAATSNLAPTAADGGGSAPVATPTPALTATDEAMSAPFGPPEPVGYPLVASYSPAVRASAPAVVNIFAERKVTEQLPPNALEQLFPGRVLPRYRQRVQQSLGSGVLVDIQGHIVTNNHVIAEADKIQVQLADGRNAEAEVVGRDPDTDLAVLRIRLNRLPVMQLGRSDHLQVGDVVLAIGSPLGLSQTVTHGIVSATGRAQLGVATFENFIQTDAAINEGNSGGALVNVRGELIGINTAVLGKNRGAEGLGVAIPVDLVRGVMREILAKGRVVRGWIGILPQDLEQERATQLGYPARSVVIDDMYIGSPAMRAGLAVNDRLVSIDGKPVHNAQDALAQIANHKPGTSVKIGGQRGARSYTVELTTIDMSTTR